MDKQRIQFVDRVIWDWVAWERDGRASPWLYPVPEWPGKPPEAVGKPRTATKRPNPLLPTTQPIESRRRPSSRVLLCRIDHVSPRVRQVVLNLDDDHKLIVWAVYLRKLAFREISERFQMTSRQVGDTRYNVLSAVNSVI